LLRRLSLLAAPPYAAIHHPRPAKRRATVKSYLADGVIVPASWSLIPSSARAKIPCNGLDGWTFVTMGIASEPFSPDSHHLTATTRTLKTWIPPLSHRMVIHGEISAQTFPSDAKYFLFL
jgi:hypothetical protein